MEGSKKIDQDRSPPAFHQYTRRKTCRGTGRSHLPFVRGRGAIALANDLRARWSVLLVLVAGAVGCEPLVVRSPVEVPAPDCATPPTPQWESPSLLSCRPDDVALVDRRRFDDLQRAIQAAPDDATVVLCPGTHQISVEVVGRRLRLVGSNLDTTLTGGTSRALTIRDSQVELFNLGFADSQAITGAGVLATDSDLHLRDVEMTGLHATQDGGAVYVVNTGLHVSSSVFSFNDAVSGGAIALVDSCLDDVGSVFEGNQAISGGASSRGGALSATSVGSPIWLRLQETQLTGNFAENQGGGLWVAGQDGPDVVQLTNSTFEDNEAFRLGGGMALESQVGQVDLVDTIFRRNGYNSGVGAAMRARMGVESLLRVQGGSFRRNGFVDPIWVVGRGATEWTGTQFQRTPKAFAFDINQPQGAFKATSLTSVSGEEAVWAITPCTPKKPVRLSDFETFECELEEEEKAP